MKFTLHMRVRMTNVEVLPNVEVMCPASTNMPPLRDLIHTLTFLRVQDEEIQRTQHSYTGI